ncbi:MAG: VWA domain-containing protein [Acidimicrobiales bacterium]
MSFLEPGRLLLGIVIVGLAVAYLAVQLWGRQRYVVRFTNLDLLASVAPKRPGWRRHVPAVLLLVALASMVVALARPTRSERVPRERATIIMAIDVSISMDATDVRPSRLDAAKAAAESFTGLLPPQINLGLVSFAGSATVLVPPTTDRELIYSAIDRLTLAEATAIGEAVIASLSSIASLPGTEEGLEVPAHIVLMSDGETTAGTPNELAVEAAHDAGVPVTTIAFGTDAGTIEYQGETLPVPVNSGDLAALADATGGSAFEAATGEQLRGVYEDIGSSIGYTEEDREVGEVFVGGAFAAALVASVLSLAWSSRLP